LVILSSSSLAPVGVSVLTLSLLPVFALRFNVELVSLAPVGLSVSNLLLLSVSVLRFYVERVVAFCSSFAAERRGGVVCLGTVVVIAIGLECA
jgi:hypothetical protein